MPQFKYRAVDRTGKFTEGTTEQPSVARVADWLARDGLMAVSIQPTSSATKRAPRARKAGRRQNARERMLHFTRELSVMLSSGLPLDRSLGILHDLADPASAEMIADVRGAVRKGKSLGDAFAERPEFSPFYINMIRAGEASGSLEASLQRMTEYLERAKALRQLVMSALTYPAILFAVAILSLVFLLAYVVPSFADLFADMGGSLPAPTRFVMGLGDFMAAWWWLVIGVIVGGVWMGRQLLQKPAVRESLDARVLTWPLVGDLVRNVETSRFARTLGVLLQGGVSLVAALVIARETVGNLSLRRELERAGNALKEGKSLSGALLEGGQFPTLALHMVQVGEETGRLEEMLLKVAGIYEDEVGTVTQRLLALLEPALILSLGVMISGIILSILLGILGVNEMIG